MFYMNNDDMEEMLRQAAEEYRLYAAHRRIDQATLQLAMKDYGKLSSETAERAVRFWQLHDKIEK